MKYLDLIIEKLLECREIGCQEIAVFIIILRYWPESISELARKARMSPSTAALACRRLASAGWVILEGKGKNLRPMPFIPHACQELMAKRLESHFSMASHKGEFLLKDIADLIFPLTEFVDNARPITLTNPLTQKPLEIDRFHPPLWAWEFWGSQHYMLTDTYADEKQLRETRARDLIKKALSQDAGITLFAVTAHDLGLRAMLNLLPADIRRIPIDEDGPYARTLARLIHRYRVITLEEERKQAKRAQSR